MYPIFHGALYNFYDKVLNSIELLIQSAIYLLFDCLSVFFIVLRVNEDIKEMNATILDLKKEWIKSRRDLSNELRDVLAFHRSSVAELRNKSTSLDKY